MKCFVLYVTETELAKDKLAARIDSLFGVKIGEFVPMDVTFRALEKECQHLPAPDIFSRYASQYLPEGEEGAVLWKEGQLTSSLVAVVRSLQFRSPYKIWLFCWLSNGQIMAL
jgi:hypothetical protein